MHILVGVTGGIAAYKAAGVIRGFTELGHSVKVIPTQNALRFIGTTTLEALSHNTVDSDLYTDVESVKHIALAKEADLVVVAPATAAFLARYASGIADDLLLNVLLATKAKVVVAPAMHTEMWQHPSTVENISKLESRGVVVIQPASGRLTGDDTGPGRLPEPDLIVREALAATVKKDWQGKRVLIAAGGTREPIDSVRYIGNRSSGKQGIALAQAAKDRGADVTLIAINISENLLGLEQIIKVSTVPELQKMLTEKVSGFDFILMPAAVSDFSVANPIEGKLSRSDKSSFTLELTSNPDILAELSIQVKQEDLETVLVGFAAEVLGSDSPEEELENRARNKLIRKNISAVVANDVTNGSVFDKDENSVVIVTESGATRAHGSKLQVANVILDEIIKLKP